MLIKDYYSGNIDDVSLSKILSAVKEAKKREIVAVAPAGYRGHDYLLYGENSCSGGGGRKSLVEVFNHSGMVKMLITNSVGHFLYHGGFDDSMEARFIACEFNRIFKKIKEQILK